MAMPLMRCLRQVVYVRSKKTNVLFFINNIGKTRTHFRAGNARGVHHAALSHCTPGGGVDLKRPNLFFGGSNCSGECSKYCNDIYIYIVYYCMYYVHP